MSVVEQVAAPPEDALAARRSLRAQIARLERELAAILVSAYPPIALAAREDPAAEARARGARGAHRGPAAPIHGARRGPAAPIHGARLGPAAPACGARAQPRLLGLAELERTRDRLAARLAAAERQAADQAGRQAEARARLHAMLADPPAHRGAAIANADLGLPGCTRYRVVPRLGPIGLLTGWWRVKISSGCPLPSAAP
jgi:hypothetical protein